MEAAEFLHSAIVGLQNLVITRYVSGEQLPPIMSSSANPNCQQPLAAGLVVSVAFVSWHRLISSPADPPL
jgi:hypothetical protein